jgi:hypothetical protein
MFASVLQNLRNFVPWSRLDVPSSSRKHRFLLCVAYEKHPCHERHVDFSKTLQYECI